jgi:hypothetical protein
MELSKKIGSDKLIDSITVGQRASASQGMREKVYLNVNLSSIVQT